VFILHVHQIEFKNDELILVLICGHYYDIHLFLEVCCNKTTIRKYDFARNHTSSYCLNTEQRNFDITNSTLLPHDKLDETVQNGDFFSVCHHHAGNEFYIV